MMTLRELLAISICGAPEYALPRFAGKTEADEFLMADEAALVAMPTRCACARNESVPSMTIVRCANALAKADAAMAILRQEGLTIEM